MELNLFKTDRTTRQKYCLKQWIKYKCKATIEAATGVGKTRMALMAIKLLKHKFPYIITFQQINFIINLKKCIYIVNNKKRKT